MVKILFAVILLFLVGTFLSVNAEVYTQTLTKDGKTYITTKTIDGTKITIETKIYDVNGVLLDTQVVYKEVTVTPVKESVYPTKTITQIPTLKPTTNPDITKSPTPGSEPKSTLVTVQSEHEVTISEDSGNLVIETAGGEQEVKVKPEVVSQQSQLKGLDQINEITLIEEDGTLKYVVSGVKKEKFLAIFEVFLPTTFVYNAQTGELEKTNQERGIKIADFFSF